MMTTSALRSGLAIAVVAALLATTASSAQAQCATCPQPTVAYSPVLTPAPAPAVYQAAAPAVAYDPWYPGKYLGRVITWPFRAVGRAITTPIAQPGYVGAPAVAPAPTFTTAAYRPTYAPTYNVGYAPATYTVGYAPTYQTVARPVTLTALDPCSCGPVCCGSCAGGGVTTAGFETYSGGCSNCASRAGYDAPISSGSRQLEPTPALGPNEQVPDQRVNRPVYTEPAADPNEGSLLNGEGSGTKASDPDANAYWNPPQLFDARDRSAQRIPTSRPSVQMWNAVYHQPQTAATAPTVRRTAYRPAPAATAPRTQQVGATGWKAAD